MRHSGRVRDGPDSMGGRFIVPTVGGTQTSPLPYKLAAGTRGMSLQSDLRRDVDNILKRKRELRTGRSVPESKDVRFAGGVTLEAAFLYADLRDSTTLASTDPPVAADVFQSFLSTTARIIKSEHGEIRSFDGDRIMAVFVGDNRFDLAAKCGLKMNWTFKNIISPKLLERHGEALKDFKLDYTTGVDAGTILAIRGGVRDDNDLVWIGRAPNIGAKLSGLKTGHRTYITGSVYDKLSDSMKTGGEPKRSMWEACRWKAFDNLRLFRSNWTWEMN